MTSELCPWPSTIRNSSIERPEWVSATEENSVWMNRVEEASTEQKSPYQALKKQHPNEKNPEMSCILTEMSSLICHS